MGDHRCTIYIEMECHGVKDELDGWYNWIPGAVDGVDDRVIDFIRGVYQRGMVAYHKEIEKYWQEQDQAEAEKRERAELARLKTKYESENRK